MNKPHVHAEVIHAWADGKRIQTWDDANEKWCDCNATFAYLFAPSERYRIKPEPKPDVVAEGIIELKNKLHRLDTASYRTEFRVSEHWETNNIKITFDGETGKLKSAEVLK